MSKKVCLLFLFQYVLGTFVFGQSALPNATSFPPRLPQAQWVAQVLDTLTLDQKIGQLFWIPYSGTVDLQDIESLVRKYHLGGIIFQDFSTDPLARLTHQLQQGASVPLLFGANNLLASTSSSQRKLSPVKPATLGAIQDTDYLYTAGGDVAKQYRARGIHLNFSPTVAIGFEASEQPLATRFAENPAVSLARGITYMQGMIDDGLIPSFRRLPAETTAQNTQAGLAERRKRKHLHDLRGSLVAQVGRIQQREPLFNPVDISIPTSTYQPSLPEFLLLNGLVFSESLSELSKKQEELLLEALRAGNDVLYDVSNVPAAIQTVRQALKAGDISQEAIDRKVAKQLQLKYQAGLDYLPADTIAKARQSDINRTLLRKQQLYEEAITIVRNEKRLLPVRTLDTLTFAALTITDHPEQTQSFQESLNHYADFAHYTIPQRSERFDYEEVYERLRRYDHIVVGIHDSDSNKRRLLPKKTLAFLKFLHEETALTLVVFDKPEQLRDVEHFSTLVCAYENDSLAQWVVPQILFGGRAAKGALPSRVSRKLPVGTGERTETLGRLVYTVPEAVGLNADTLQLIDTLANWAIREQATPGCQVLVARNGAVVFSKSYGYQTYDSLLPINNQTIYDIASVTKVAATTQAMMFLQERGAIKLDNKLSSYLPELYNTDKRNITVREAMLHRAGLRSYVPFWQMTRDKYGLHTELYRFSVETDFTNQIASGLYATPSLRDSLWQWTIQSKMVKQRGRRLSWKPNYSYRYSDLGFYMLHRLIEQVTQQPMDVFMEQNFYAPLGLQTLTYQPLCKFSQLRIAPTEEDKLFRNSLVRGTVHDEGAALCGGVAGHAGLFSNAHDLAVLMQMNLQDGYYGGTRYLQPGTVARFSTRQFNDSRRALGWDKPEYIRDGGPTAPEAPFSSYGHLGFTGTSVWVDPKYNLVYVFLSNRVHPDARNTKLLTEGIRTKIQSVVYRAMEDYDGR